MLAPVCGTECHHYIFLFHFTYSHVSIVLHCPFCISLLVGNKEFRIVSMPVSVGRLFTKVKWKVSTSKCKEAWVKQGKKKKRRKTQTVSDELHPMPTQHPRCHTLHLQPLILPLLRCTRKNTYRFPKSQNPLPVK